MGPLKYHTSRGKGQEGGSRVDGVMHPTQALTPPHTGPNKGESVKLSKKNSETE